MQDLTFGEQVKIILSRKNMTIKQLAEMIEEETGRPMSRQNLTQRLVRDNFQEQDMRMISSILGCPFQLSIFPDDDSSDVDTWKSGNASRQHKKKQDQDDGQQVLTFPEESGKNIPPEEMPADERDMTIGELFDINEELENEEPEEETEAGDDDFEPVIQHEDEEEDLTLGEMNPYTGHEYQSNSVRTHPTRIGYVQVYDRKQHSWTDMTEWAFLGYQERKKSALGKKYEPPIYLD